MRLLNGLTSPYCVTVPYQCRLTVCYTERELHVLYMAWQEQAVCTFHTRRTLSQAQIHAM